MSQIIIKVFGELEELGLIYCQEKGYISFYDLLLDNLIVLDSNSKFYSGKNPFLFTYFASNKYLFATDSNFINIEIINISNFCDSLNEDNICDTNFKCALFLEIYLSDKEKQNRAYILIRDEFQNFKINKGDYLIFEFKMEVDSVSNKNDIILKKLLKK